MHKIMFSAGEVSGDMHGANLARALKDIEPDIELFGFGGKMMQEAGVKLFANIKDYNVMGFYEVLMNLRRLFKLRALLKHVMEIEKPDVLVLIDYPDFNWRLAAIAKKLNIAVFSYIPPSAWAWRKGRAKKVAVMADMIAAIFPFEMPVYEQAGANIEFVGNPLVETVKPSLSKENACAYLKVDRSKKNILLLPGSRKQEIKNILPIMLESACLFAKKESKAAFHIAVAEGITKRKLQEITAQYPLEIKFHSDKLYDLMQNCDIAFATSGTVVLEAALMGLPTVVLYRMSKITYYIANLFVKVKFFSLPNILADREIIPELLQDEVNPRNIIEKAENLLANGKDKNRENLLSIRDKLGKPGVAKRVAMLILRTAAKNV